MVEELALYEPSGEGPHVYLRLTRERWNTRALAVRLAEVCGVVPSEVGYAGLKDRQARVTQTFSLPLPSEEPDAVARRIEESLPVVVESASRHRNKLKPGHLLGNRFDVEVRGAAADALPRARSVAAALAETGVANYFGPQRQGTEGDNAARGRRALVQGRGARGWLHRLLLSAWQSERFDDWLAARIGRGWFSLLLDGDLAKKRDTGGLFLVEDAAVEQPRLDRGEVSPTGPLFGARMRWPEGEPASLEREVLAADEVTEAMLRGAHLPGSRRPGRVHPEGLEIEPTDAGLLFSFSLPKGSYATTLLREFQKG